jgi:hypothetical protein
MLSIDQRKIAGPATGAPFADGKSAVRRTLISVHAPGERRVRSRR